MVYTSKFIAALAGKTMTHAQAPEWCDAGIAHRLRIVAPEFIGKPELCLFVIHLIIRLRRGIDTKHSYRLFVRIVHTYQALLVEQLNSRWLISVLDTIADYGAPEEKSQAMSIVAMFNMLKLAETELIFAKRAKHLPPEGSAYPYGRKFLWDGIQPMHVCEGDMLANMVLRTSLALANNAFLHTVFVELLTRACQNNTLLGRIYTVNELFRRQANDLRGGGQPVYPPLPNESNEDLFECKARPAYSFSTRYKRFTTPLKRFRQKLCSLHGRFLKS